MPHHAEPHDAARILRISLGILWLLDGILQLQPVMFTGAFVKNVLAPNLANQPHVIAAIVAFGIRVASVNPFWFNIAAAGIQLAIGALLIFPFRKNIQRAGLRSSVIWGLIVWAFGEGFGMLATGSATFYTGAPGAALAYAILALFLLGAEKRAWLLEKLPTVLGVVFLAGAALNAMPMFWQTSMLSMLSGIPAASTWLGALGTTGTMVGNLIAIDALAALGVFLIFLPNRTVAWATLVFLLAVWIIGQNFGGILTFPNGLATDPNMAPLLALFLLPLLVEHNPATRGRTTHQTN